jgi:hypothetical protein
MAEDHAIQLIGSDSEGKRICPLQSWQIVTWPKLKSSIWISIFDLFRGISFLLRNRVNPDFGAGYLRACLFKTDLSSDLREHRYFSAIDVTKY